MIRIDPDKEDFDICKAINGIFRHIKQPSNQLTKLSTRKGMVNKISIRLLELEFKSENMLKSKAIKHIVKKSLPDYE